MSLPHLRSWILLLALLAGGISARAAEAPDAVLKTTVDTVLTTLNDTSLSADARWDKIRATSLKRFDLERIGKLTLGSTNWGKLSDAQQKEFLTLFTDLLLHSYSKRLDEYSGERIEFVKSEVADGKASVNTLLISKGRRIPVEYKMYLNDTSGWLVYDVIIDGVSIVRTYRGQYDDYLKANSPDAFMTMIRAKAAEDQ